MNALTIFIRRPVLATMLTVLLLVLGLFSYRTIGVDLNPKVDFPIVAITTVLRGASPEEIESQVTKPIEEAVNTVAGIDELNSYNNEGLSRIVVRFKLERNIEEAAQDVRDKVATVARLLPVGTDPPVILKYDFGVLPVVNLVVSGPRDMKEISEIARVRVKEAIENVSGVGAVTAVGARRRAINVVLDLDRLQSYGIPIARVKAALLTQNVEIPSGRVDRDSSEQVLRTLARVERVQDFADLVVANVNGRQITIGDIGRVEDSTEEPRSLARLWNKDVGGAGVSAVSLTVQKQSGTNTLQVVSAVRQRLDQIAPLLPAGIKVDVVGDQSTFIKNSIDELQLHLLLGGLLAALAVFLFLGNLRSTLIAALAIPTSLVATFTFIRLFNFTLNNMTLLGLTLAVGIVIDDAIVVLENIFRHLEELKKTPLQAAADGLKEIGLAVLATTTSLIVIFLPMAFMEGMAGRFFFEFGITVAFAIGISLIISFTLTPMLSSRFLKAKHGGTSKQNFVWRGIQGGYTWLLNLALNWRLATVAIAIACVAATPMLVKRLGMDFLPMDDTAEFALNLKAPAGLSLSSVDQLLHRIEGDLHQVRGVARTLTQIGGSGGSEDVTAGSIYVGLVPLDQRTYSQKDVMRDVRELLKKYPEVRSAVADTHGAGGGRSGYQFSYNINGPDIDTLIRLSNQLAQKLRATPGFVDVDTSLAARQPELRVSLDRPKAADLNISASDVAMTLRTMVAGETVGKYREGVEQYDVWLRLDRKDRNDAEVIARLPIASPRAGLVPLSHVATLSEGKGPAEIDRYNRQRLVNVYANLDGIDLGGAGKLVDKLVKDEIKLPTGYQASGSGSAKFLAETLLNFLLAFLLAFVFMYIVLAAQFESFLHPVTILLSLPLTLPFAFASLAMLGETLNLYSLLGVFMLFGIVKKNGILQIDYTNTLRVRGKPLREAIIEANNARLRPILMTTFTLIAGMTPIALGQGPGAAARASMAKVIIGGQALSLLITLLIVPVAYSLFESLKRQIGIGREEKPVPVGTKAELPATPVVEGAAAASDVQ